MIFTRLQSLGVNSSRGISEQYNLTERQKKKILELAYGDPLNFQQPQRMPSKLIARHVKSNDIYVFRYLREYKRTHKIPVFYKLKNYHRTAPLK